MATSPRGPSSGATLDEEQLTQLFRALRADGYALAPARLGDALAMLRYAGLHQSDAPPERTASLITPLLARSPAEQEDIARRLQRLGLPVRMAQEPTFEALPPNGDVAPEPRAWAVAVPSIVVLLAVAGAAYLMGRADEVPPGELPPPPPAPQPLPADQVRTQTLVGAAYHALQWSFAVAAPLLLIGWWFMQRRWHRFVAQGRDETFLDRFDVGSRALGAPLFADPAIGRLAQRWRRFRRVPTRSLDEARTIEETIARGGLFTPVYRTKPLSPDYTVLIEEESRHDHLARLSESLFERLAEEGVAIERYRYQGNIARLRSGEEAGMEDMPLEQVESSERSTLIVVGSLDALVEPLSRRPRRRALADLRRWSHRVLLSTRPPRDWGAAELGLMKSGFSLGTARESGLSALADHAARGFPADEPLIESAISVETAVAPAARPSPAVADTDSVADALAERVRQLQSEAPAAGPGHLELALIGELLARGSISEALARIFQAEADQLFSLDMPRALRILRSRLEPETSAQTAAGADQAAQAAPTRGKEPPVEAEHSFQPLEPKDLAAAAAHLRPALPTLYDFLERSADESGPRILLLTGPPASGKTIVLAMLRYILAHLGHSLVRVDAGGSEDPHQLVSNVAAAFPLSFDPDFRVEAEKVHVTLERLASVAEPVILAIDNVDGSDGKVMQTVAQLARILSQTEFTLLRLVLVATEPVLQELSGRMVHQALEPASLRQALIRALESRSAGSSSDLADRPLEELIRYLAEVDPPD